VSEGVNRTVDVGRDVLDTPRPEISSVLLLLFDDVVESICLTTNRFGLGEREREREREKRNFVGQDSIRSLCDGW